MRKSTLGALLAFTAISSSFETAAKNCIKTDSEGIKAYLLKQRRLAENNPVSKREQKKSRGKRRKAL